MPGELEELAEEVQRRGLGAVLLTPPGRPSRIRITPRGREVAEEIELTGDGLRWAWGGPLDGATAPEQADAVNAYFASVP